MSRFKRLLFRDWQEPHQSSRPNWEIIEFLRQTGVLSFGSQINFFFMRFILPFIAVVLMQNAMSAERIEITTQTRENRSQPVTLTPEVQDARSFIITAKIDPSTKPEGDNQGVTSLLFSNGPQEQDALHRKVGSKVIGLELREGSGRAMWEFWIDGESQQTKVPDPKPRGWMDRSQYQHPNVETQKEGPYWLQIRVAPEGRGSLIRVYFLHGDRPVGEYKVDWPIRCHTLLVRSGRGGNTPESNTAVVDVEVRPSTSSEVRKNMKLEEVVMESLEPDHPEMKGILDSWKSGNRREATRALLEHFANRSMPKGPDIDKEPNHPAYMQIADEALKGSYGTLGWFSQFATQWTDALGQVHSWTLPDGKINWAREDGHLNRHFHWVSLAKAFHETGDRRYAERFSFEVRDWVTREPFYWPQCPQVGKLNLMDGTVFTKGYMNTSNIGRRCELTWWPTYEVFRKTEHFNDDAHLAMLVGFLRQARLLMNPTSFAPHDDGGMHGTMALLQTGLMLPELKESKIWIDEAEKRWQIAMKEQFYPDGSHVSGSTGYNWASLGALENYIALRKRTGKPAPKKDVETLALALNHPIALSRPDQGQIDLNDGGWGMIDDHFRRIVENIFPDRQDFIWVASKGKEGTVPAYKSIYFPHAGHVVMRTGWGEREKFLFMDAGPMGASHGKNDKLSIYLALGPHQLISSGGRGSYDANPYSAYTGSTYSYNTLIVDDMPQQRVHLANTHKGHVPEKRRWISNEQYDYAEGVYQSGWYGPKSNVMGSHHRQTLFIKGSQPNQTGYWVIIDSVEAADEAQHQYKALFHSRRNEAVIDPETKSFKGHDISAWFEILPASPDEIAVKNIRAQTSPYIQGWHVVGRDKAPMNTAEFIWDAKGASTQAWVLTAGLTGEDSRIKDLTLKRLGQGEFLLSIDHKDGGRDLIYRRPNGPDLQPFQIGSQEINGDIGVISTDAKGKPMASLDLLPE